MAQQQTNAVLQQPHFNQGPLPEKIVHLFNTYSPVMRLELLRQMVHATHKVEEKHRQKPVQKEAHKSSPVNITAEGVPHIDFGQFSQGVEAQRKVAKQVLDGLKEYGSIMVLNHSISEELVQSTFTEAKKYFHQPIQKKLQHEYTSVESNRGYLSYGREKLHKDEPDRKETLEIGKEGEPGFQNPWPSAISSFRPKMLEYFAAMNQLHLAVMRCIEIALELNEGELVSKCNKNHENLRLLHYPESAWAPEDQDQKRTGVHTDYGTLTMLVQGEIGGLRVKRRDGKWFSVAPVKGGIIVQVGDMLQRWTNDVLYAPPHYVSALPVTSKDGTSKILPERFSSAFFCNPNKDVRVEALRNTYSETSPKKYKPFNAYHFLNTRLRSTL